MCVVLSHKGVLITQFTPGVTIPGLWMGKVHHILHIWRCELIKGSQNGTPVIIQGPSPSKQAQDHLKHEQRRDFIYFYI